MRSAALLVVVAGCGFHANSAPDTPQPADAAAAIDASGTNQDASVKTDAAAAQFCNPDDGDVIACYEFENNTDDHSGNQLNATMTRVSYANGKFGKGLHVDDNSAGDTADKSALDVAALTIEAWINPSQLPGDEEKAYVVDINNQYALYVDQNGDLNCTLIGGPSLSTAPTIVKISTNQWTHVACTYDGIVQAVLYVGGAVAAAKPGNGALGTGGTTGLSIGGNNPSSSGNGRFNGMIDQLRLMKVARTTPQICADTGKTLCL